MGKSCLVGSTNARVARNVSKHRGISITTPMDLKRKGGAVEEMVFVMTVVSLGMFGTFIILAVLLLWVKGAKTATAMLAPIDLFFKEVLRSPEGEPRPSIAGAIFTVLLLILAAFFSGSIILGYAMDRVEETKGIIPYLVGKSILEKAPKGEEVTGFVFNAVITLRLWGNGADCGDRVPQNCSVDISVNVVPSLPCTRVKVQCSVDAENACSITFRGWRCLLGIEPVELRFELLHPEAEATEIESSISLSSSIPEENADHDDFSRTANAVLVKRISAQSGTVFKGLPPSRVQVVCVPSVYMLGKDPDYDALQTGMHVELAPDNTFAGAMSDAATLTYSQGLYVTIGLQRGTTVLRTNRKDEKTIAEAIGEAGGFVSSMNCVISFAAIALIVVDIFIRKSLRKNLPSSERVYAGCVVTSKALLLHVPAFYLRFSLGRIQQFKRNELDEDLVKVSPDIAAKLSECGEKGSVVLKPMRFEVLLREEDLDVDLAAEFETLTEIEVQCSIELVESSKSKVLASGQIPFPRCSECADGEVTMALDIYPPKKLNRNTLHNEAPEDFTKDPLGTLYLQMNRFTVATGASYLAKRDDVSPTVVLPEDCALMQNHAEASLALYKLEHKLDQLSNDYVSMSLDLSLDDQRLTSSTTSDLQARMSILECTTASRSLKREVHE